MHWTRIWTLVGVVLGVAALFTKGATTDGEELLPVAVRIPNADLQLINVQVIDDRRSRSHRFEELEIELLQVQRWIQETGQRLLMIFEGRDAAGKGGKSGKHCFSNS